MMIHKIQKDKLDIAANNNKEIQIGKRVRKGETH